jgi:putative ABC transport system permease protein
MRTNPFSSRQPRSLLVALGLLAISLGVTLIASASQTTVVTVEQELSHYWRTTYDILVRPSGSRSAIEEKYGLVEANHLAGIVGGIAYEQYQAIKALPEIEIAAVGVLAPLLVGALAARVPPAEAVRYE